jgi:hypothetical protein
MKRSALIVAGLALCALPVLADAPGGTIAVFADPLGENCYPEEIGPGLFQIYVVHLNHPGMTASEFMVVADGDFTGVYLGEYLSDPNWVAVGYAFAGVAVAYGGCRSAPTHLLTMSFYSTGTSKKCCQFAVVPHPQAGGIHAVTCDFEMVPAEGGTSVVNPDGSCPCSIPGVTTTARLSTWGQMKSLYADG